MVIFSPLHHVTTSHHIVSNERARIPSSSPSRARIVVDRDDVTANRVGSRDVIATSAHGHLFAGVGGQVEDADAEQRDEDARDDEVDRVEQRLAADLERVRDLRPVGSFNNCATE